ncbi:zinc finger domain-containing protein [Lentzea cavernae]|uniref:DNA-binding phage zinc finger domain-containing protein n=1 Tax=Lentzea cavernae TaxID=2020703 RepID=A0ABQ3MR11_9PSEU|nr:hypothetical protein [Lentzea cavernae]GHH57624.1 hypothetical protein GCM10017774_77450 [Lentzea cavernae]
MTQTSTHPTDTAHLHDGDRITLEELSIHLSAAAVWLRQLAIAAETPSVPVELEEFCDDLDRAANELVRKAERVAEVNGIIADEKPLHRKFNGSEPWGFAAHGADPDKTRYGKKLSTVLTHHQIVALARPDMPWRSDQTEPGIAYLDGLDGLPGLDRWESKRGAKRRAQEREQRILATTRQTPCPSCGAEPNRECRTKTGRVAELSHQPRRQAAVAHVDAAEAS